MQSSRGRARGRARAAATGDPPMAGGPPPGFHNQNRGGGRSPQPPTEAMGRMSMRGGGRGGMRGGSSGRGGARGAARAPTYDIIKTRPDHVAQDKRGSSGTPMTLTTNYFPLDTKGFRLNQYRVDMNIDEDRTFVKRAVLKRLQNKIPPNIFDGTVMWTTVPVFPAAEKEKTFTSTYAMGDEQRPCEVKIKLVGEVFPQDPSHLHVYNVIKKEVMDGLRLTQVDRGYFDYQETASIPNWKLEVTPGYQTSIRQHENGLLLNVEIKSKCMRTDTVYDQMRLLMPNVDRMKKSLIGAIVMTQYNRKTYRIDDIDTSASPSSTFTLNDKEGSTTTFADYFKKKYDVQIRDMKQPLLISMPKERDIRGGRAEPVSLIPELCFMTGLADEQRNNYKLMEALSKYTRPTPQSRVETLLKFNRRMNSTKESQQTLKEWEIDLKPSLATVQGRQLPPQVINLGKKTFKYDPNSKQGADWGFGIKDSLMTQVPVTKWMWVYPQSMFQGVDRFYKALSAVAPGLMGQRLPEPKWKEIKDTRIGDYMQALNEAVEMNPHMILIAIPNEKGPHYANIKKLLFTGPRPIPNQIVTDSKIFKKILAKPQNEKSFATKILMQMMVKLGAEPWGVNIPVKDMMVCGFDTYHDTAKKGFSYGAFVATTNNTLTRYYSQVSKQMQKQEISNEIPGMMINALRAYKDINGHYPTRIFVYRDGVGDGQVEHVKETELKSVLDTMKMMIKDKNGQPYEPKLGYIIVSKRINARFFTNIGQNRFDNPKAGTIIDDVVTLPERYDFFMVSQSVNQGTVNPTSYNVIYDTSGFKPDIIQQLTYKLTHLYFNWPGTVKVPAPCQYAHKLAYLVGETLHDQPSSALSKYAFYL